ncbi:hypothetical protein DPMN_118439 [Dreissena polymorpha]|uniref:Uncharacterized protein n=1 Tax=Dreissena polymorpha TaxID=45954 RepID=A0A9D4GK69_DREPO|nr:hypothetical protein DPMN_118439 [Dreissena polymorpha]
MKGKVMMMCFVKPATCPIMEDKELGYGREEIVARKDGQTDRRTTRQTAEIITISPHFSKSIDSVFNMKRPYDLVAFMKQEDSAAMLDKLKQELLSREDETGRTEDRDTDNGTQSDVDCLAAGKQTRDSGQWLGGEWGEGDESRGRVL